MGLFSANAPQHPVIEIKNTRSPSIIVAVGITLEYRRTSGEKIPYRPNPIRTKPVIVVKVFAIITNILPVAVLVTLVRMRKTV